MPERLFILFEVYKDKIAVDLGYFVKVTENVGDFVNYNSNKIKVLQLDLSLGLQLYRPHPIVVILNYENNFFAVAVDSVLDTISVSDSNIKTVSKIINSPKSIVSEVIIKNSEIIKIISLPFLADISDIK